MHVDEFPIEVRHLMLYRQQEQNGKRDWSVFQNNRMNGFEWAITPEKHDFWSDVINGKDFNVFYAKYPKVEYPKDMPEEIKMLALDRRVEQGWEDDNLETFGFTWIKTSEGVNFWSSINEGAYSFYYDIYTPTSYGGEIADFPPEVVELMLQRQFEQTGKRDVSIFEACKYAGNESNGFTWENTIERHYFWKEVIEYKKFHLFFEKYPKGSLINSQIKTKQNDKESTTNNTGIKVFKPVATITNGEKRTGTRISGRSSKTTIGSGHISYQAVIGY